MNGILDDIQAGAGSIFAGRMPLYIDGKAVGYFDSDARFCTGHVYFYGTAPNPVPSFSTWYVKPNIFGPLVRADTYCVSQGLTPTWLSADDVAKIQLTAGVSKLKWPLIGGAILLAFIALK